MTDQKIVVTAVRDAGRILAQYLEPGEHNAEETIAQLIDVSTTKTWRVRSIGLKKVMECGW
jgi:hypothetical protein